MRFNNRSGAREGEGGVAGGGKRSETKEEEEKKKKKKSSTAAGDNIALKANLVKDCISATEQTGGGSEGGVEGAEMLD